jgi:hypothetical protein
MVAGRTMLTRLETNDAAVGSGSETVTRTMREIESATAVVWRIKWPRP